MVKTLLLAALLLTGCAGTGKTVFAPKDTPPPVVERGAPGDEVRQAGEVIISAQEVINRVGGIVAPTVPSVAAPAQAERRLWDTPDWQKREPDVEYRTSEYNPGRDGVPYTTTAPYTTAEILDKIDAAARGLPTVWLNTTAGAERFHRDPKCRFLWKGAVTVSEDEARRVGRTPCRTCGGGK